jgi:hypothetical protein
VATAVASWVYRLSFDEQLELVFEVAEVLKTTDAKALRELMETWRMIAEASSAN